MDKNKETQKKRTRYKAIDPQGKFTGWVKKLNFESYFFGKSFAQLNKAFSLERLLHLTLFSVVLSAVIYFKVGTTPDYKIDDIAVKDFTSPASFELVDKEATDHSKKEALKGVLPIFNLSHTIYDQALDQIFTSFKEAQKNPEMTRVEFEELLGAELKSRDFEWLKKSEFSDEISQTLRQIIEYWGTLYIANQPKQHLTRGQNKYIVFRPFKSSGEEVLVDEKQVIDIRSLGNFESVDVQMLKKWSVIDKKRLYKIALNFLKPNLVFDSNKTEATKKLIVEKIIPTVISVKKNHVVIPAGTVIRQSHVNILEKIKKLQPMDGKGASFLLVALFLLFVSLILSSYVKHLDYFFSGESFFTPVLFATTLISVVIWKLFYFISSASMNQFFAHSIESLSFVFATPYVLASMIGTMILRSPLVLGLYILFSSLVFVLVLQPEQSFSVFVVVFFTGLVAARKLYDCETRRDIYIGGVHAALTSTSLLLISSLIFNESLPHFQLFILAICCFFGALFSLLLSFAFIPLLENFFQVTTNLKLLDLASMNHPILQQLIVKAPGTYHHSMVVGSMVEAAARDIGLRALLGKVMGYFHDIGKLEHASYFIENQKKSENPHDHISPYLSKTIIMAHVKDGAEMALKHNLGKEIVDGIMQHHGTTCIRYFFEKAKDLNDHEQKLDDQEFRYAGPKPQFKESALLMIADSIEAAARSIDHPTPAKLSTLVEKMVEKKFTDGQLDECNLSFEELSKIKSAFYRIIVGVYHSRIEYPEDEKVSVKKISHV